MVFWNIVCCSALLVWLVMLLRIIGRRLKCKMTSQTANLFILPTSSCGRIRGLEGSLIVRLWKVKNFHASRPICRPTIAVSESQVSVSAHFSNRVSRAARIKAQDVLLEYLHSTRGLTYNDAEHMSRNSPHFVEKLLTQVETEEDVSKALGKLFRYFPVNEFEPFLQSLGLNPSEISPLLPRDKIYLSDDPALLNNYHVLCNYGIARTEIGNLYKEVNEIFTYENGLLSMKLRALENLGLSKPAVIKLVACCPLVLVNDGRKDLVSVLDKLKELGFPSDWIGGYLVSKHSYNWSRMLGTLSFLEDVGYGNIQMGDLIKKNPSLLFAGSGRQVYVVVGRLLKLGVDMDGVYSLFVENPEMLSPKFIKNIWKALYFMYEIGLDNDCIAKIVTMHLKLLGSHSLLGPKTVIGKMDGDKKRLCQIIKEDPSDLFRLASKLTGVQGKKLNGLQTPDNLVDKTRFLLKLGFVENSDEMAKALKQFRGRGDQLQERFDCLVQAGLDCNVVSDMIKQAPTVLNQSKDILEKKISLLKNLEYPMESIVTFPSYLCYNINRVEQRFAMYVWLRDKGVAKPMLSVSTLLACADARFTKYFVHIHPEGPAKWESIQNQS